MFSSHYVKFTLYLSGFWLHRATQPRHRFTESNDQLGNMPSYHRGGKSTIYENTYLDILDMKNPLVAKENIIY